METALGLGSNLGNRLECLRQARSTLEAMEGLRFREASPVYESDPVGVQPEHSDINFLNAVLIFDCDLTPEALSEAVHVIEDQMGRKRTSNRYAPRMIDIDILYLGEIRCDTPALRLPHPEVLKRRFVCAPLSDLRPNHRLPGATLSISEALEALPEKPSVRRLANAWDTLPLG